MNDKQRYLIFGAMWALILVFFFMLALSSCATVNEDCLGTEDYDVCVKEERAVKRRMANQEKELFYTSCRRAGGVAVCDHWGDCECVEKAAVKNIFQ